MVIYQLSILFLLRHLQEGRNIIINEFNPSIIRPAHQGYMAEKDAATGIQESLDISLNAIKNINQSPLSDERFPVDLFEQRYKDKFALYTEDNIKNCTSLLVKEPKNCNLYYDKQRGVCFDFLRHLKNS